MKKRLLLTLLIIIFGLSLIAPIGITVGTEITLSNNYERAYTFDVKHGNYRFTQTLYTSVPPSLYDYYRSEVHQVNGERDYAKFVTPNPVRTIAENLRRIAPNGSKSDEDFANDVLALVHQIPYAVSNSKYPVETIVDNSGDCDVSSFLVASIMKAGGLDVVLLVYRGLPGSHMNVGVYLPHKPTSVSADIDPVGYEHDNKTYWVAECTPTGNWKVGHQPDSFAHLEPSIISIENSEGSSPAIVSSNLGSPLVSSSISITLSLENSSASENRRPLTISGSISPAYSGKKVVMYISKDWSSSQVFQTDTDSSGNYSLTWNVTSAGAYHIRTSLVAFSNYAGSDSEVMTFFSGAYPTTVDEYGLYYQPNPKNLVYQASLSNSVQDFLKSDLEGANISLSGEFMILKSNQTMPIITQTITIPEMKQTIFLSRRRTLTTITPERTIEVQRREQPNNNFGFILENKGGSYSASVKLLGDSDVFQIEKQLGGNNATFMNVSTTIQKNIWYKADVLISNDGLTTELRGENNTLLKTVALKGNSFNITESGILISCEPYNLIAFKKLKVENLDQPPDELPNSIYIPVNGPESLFPYITLALTLVIAVVSITYFNRLKMESSKKT
jgi:hypothetical protein